MSEIYGVQIVSKGRAGNVAVFTGPDSLYYATRLFANSTGDVMSGDDVTLAKVITETGERKVLRVAVQCPRCRDAAIVATPCEETGCHVHEYECCYFECEYCGNVRADPGLVHRLTV